MAVIFASHFMAGMEEYRGYWRSEWNTRPPEWLGPENPEWQGNYLVWYWMAGWKKIVFRYLDTLLSMGFSGIYLDKIDAFWDWVDLGVSEPFAGRKMAEFLREVIQFIWRKAGWDFLIIPQNGEDILLWDPDLIQEVNGWAVEDLFFFVDTFPNPDAMERLIYLDAIRQRHLYVLVVDYLFRGFPLSRADSLRFTQFIQHCRNHRFVPYIAGVDRALDTPVILSGWQP